ncbi:fam-l protein [Plasmodium malariae]|uniref:Fam-l protein n=1 Tax=Plasmodium malariae TaxID=5858 RepID=A0A1D3JHN3_PLAMA|nr:fam-l protein [Plasmodium malariae]SBT85721.1 fam-l protein [Plasmodium malariae]
MEEKINSMLFVKITTLIVLSWICYIYIYTSTKKSSLDKCYSYCKKLYSRNYRLMAQYNEDKDSVFVCLNENVPNGVNYKRDIANNEKLVVEKEKKLNRRFSRNVRCHKKNMKNKSCVFETKKYSRLEKKIFKELDYTDFLKNSRTISEKTYNKIMRKKYGLRLALPVIVILLLSTSLILDFGGFGLIGALIKTLNAITTGWLESLHIALKGSFLCDFLKSVGKGVKSVSRKGKAVPDHYYVTGFFGIFIYLIPFIVIGVTIILWVIYYHKKVKKYEKIKFMKR